MPRTARASVGGMCYHILNRGNNRMEVFHSSEDYSRFVALMAEAQSRVELDIFAVCLMPNHFHLLVRPKADEDLSTWVQWLLTSHVRTVAVVASEEREYLSTTAVRFYGIDNLTRSAN